MQQRRQAAHFQSSDQLQPGIDSSLPSPAAAGSILGFAKRLLPAPVRHWAGKQQHRFRCWPPIGWARFRNMRRVMPISPVFGCDRGQAIDRYYIEQFLVCHATDIRGDVLEIGNNTYTVRYGGKAVRRSDVLHVQAGNPKATIIADLASGNSLPSDRFDCIIVTQTLQFIYEVRAAVATLHRILKPGGVVLATVPGISQISRYDMDRWGDYWRFTTRSLQRIFKEVFPDGDVTVASYGNVLAASAFLQGLAAGELKQEELDHYDRDYEMVITARARRSQ